MTLHERAKRFLRQSAPHHREREWHKLLEEFVQAPVSETAALDRDFQLTEAMHLLGANEGETILELAHRITSDKNWLRAQRDTAEEKLAETPLSATPPKMPECPYPNWSYEEQQAWKAGYYQAMQEYIVGTR